MPTRPWRVGDVPLSQNMVRVMEQSLRDGQRNPALIRAHQQRQAGVDVDGEDGDDDVVQRDALHLDEDLDAVLECKEGRGDGCKGEGGCVWRDKQGDEGAAAVDNLPWGPPATASLQKQAGWGLLG